MTLLYSYYTPKAIVFAADSQITEWKEGRRVRHQAQTKLIRLPGVGIHPQGGLIGFFGQAVIGNPQMTMSAFLRGQAQRAQSRTWPDVGEFVEHLVDQLDEWRTPTDRKRLSGFHLGAFEQRAGTRVPVFWFIRNAYRYDEMAGKYTDIRPVYAREEQLLGAYLKGHPLGQVRRLLNPRTPGGFFRWFRNGNLELAGPIDNGIDLSIQMVTGRARSHYAIPDTIEGLEALARASIEVPRTFSRMLYRRGDPPIGGRINVESLDWDAR